MATQFVLLSLIAFSSPFSSEEQVPDRVLYLDQGRTTVDFSFSPDGRALILLDDNLSIWETATCRLRTRLFPPQDTGWGSMEIFPDGKKILLIGPDSTRRLRVIVKGLPMGNFLGELGGDQESLRVVSISPDGRLLATVYDNDHRIIFSEALSGGRRAVLKLPCRKDLGVALASTFSQDGCLFAVSMSKQASIDSELFLCHCKRKNVRSLGTFPDTPIVSLRFSRDSK